MPPSFSEPTDIAPASQEAPRKPYTAPQLTEYGDIQDLTQGTGGISIDADITPSSIGV